MSSWPKRPVVYELNTWIWLEELSRTERRPVHLGTVPREAWDAIAELGIDAVWLMGVWERSPQGAEIARDDPSLQAEFRRALPDYNPADVVGSPYCVRRYVVDANLGGPLGLATARRMLAERGIRLILDFVPNHVAVDHPWVVKHPEYFVHGDEPDRARAPAEFFDSGGTLIAHGRDPHFPPWSDTAQLNAFSPHLRRAVAETLQAIAAQCDGLRCDMAMLLTDEVFEQTWGERVGSRLPTPFWKEIIHALKAHHPDFLFLAEAYWGLEWELQRQGFDFCYDKPLYDRLLHDTAESVRQHVSADLQYQEKLLRFIENHDEPRAAAAFGGEKVRAAAVAVATLPGATLWHDGQFEGRRLKLPIQLGRRLSEPLDPNLQAFYGRLLRVVRGPAFRLGRWVLCQPTGWPDNPSCQNLLAWCWDHPEQRYLIVINLSVWPSQARVPIPWQDLAGRSWLLVDAFSGDVFARDGNELVHPGLYVALEPWAFHFLRIEPAPA